MTDLASELDALAALDPDRKAKLLADLAELLNRSSYQGESGGFSFHDPELATLPDRLPEAEIRSIAQRVGLILLDSCEPEGVRAAAAFVLSKTHTVAALESIVRAVSADVLLPAEVVRQCAFAYAVLSETCGAAGPGIDTEIVGRHFHRYGVPWDEVTRRILVDQL